MTLARRWSPYAWASLALFIVTWRILRFEVTGGASHGAIPQHVKWEKLYNYTVLLSNYFTEGYVRRGLAGSVFYFTSGHSVEIRLILFHVFSALWLLVPLLILLNRLARTEGRAWMWLSVVLALSPQLFMAWARDVARVDMFLAGFAAWALLACLDRRYLLAAAIVFISSQAHEVGLIYGGALCLAMGLLDYHAGKLRLGHGLAAIGLLGVLWVVALAAHQAFGPTPQAMARDMLMHSAPPDASIYSDPTSFRDLAIYLTVGGVRTLVSSACVMFLGHAAYFFIASIYIVLAIYGVVLPAWSRLRIGLLLLVGFLPMTILTILAIDYGRWLSFAVLNWWLINAALQLRGVEPLAIERWPPPASLGAAALVFAMGPGEFPGANLATSTIAERIWHGAPRGNRFDRCDPTWRSTVDPGWKAKDPGPAVIGPDSGSPR